ncbi:MAG: acyl-CoA ligase (AMP-forming), exosortase A system-associated [Planctomycetota bacterium]
MTTPERSLPSLLDSAAAAPAPFLTVGGRTCGGREFRGLAMRAASRLRDLGFRRGDRLCLHLHRCLEESIEFFAVWLCGGIAVPINPKLKDAQVAHVLRDSEPFGVVTSAVKATLLRDPEKVFAGTRVFSPEDILGAGPAAPDGSDGAFSPCDERPGDPAVILYTSGSSGPSKGVVQSRRNLAAGARIVASYLGLSPKDHVLALLPFSFDYGLNQLLSAMHAGCRVTAADYLGAADLGRVLADARPTGLAGVPSLWHDLCRGLETGALDGSCLATLRWLTNSGGRLALPDIRRLRRAIPRARIFSMYGLTEAFRSAFLDPAEIDRRPDSFGKAIEGVELLLVDPATGSVLEGEGTGELVHAGALVASGYWRNERETRLRFRPDPRGGGSTVVYSGDLVRRDREGFLYFVSRMDRMMKVHGHRVSPDEVLEGVRGFPGVEEAAVVSVPGGSSGDRIILFVAGPAASGIEDRLMRHCRSELPGYMVPWEIRVKPELPRNANGKVDLDSLRGEAQCTGPC